jgi:hypothetical protein
MKTKLEVSPRFTRDKQPLTLEAWTTKYPGLLITKSESNIFGYCLTHRSTGMIVATGFDSLREAHVAASILGPLINWSVEDGAQILFQSANLSDEDACKFAAGRGVPTSDPTKWKSNALQNSKNFNRDVCRQKR